uniref:Secreted protein n=1 Tax=Macrostomum lignano TaxID=282301 RepID=A0A1I8ICB6_9PLAT
VSSAQSQTLRLIFQFALPALLSLLHAKDRRRCAAGRRVRNPVGAVLRVPPAPQGRRRRRQQIRHRRAGRQEAAAEAAAATAAAAAAASPQQRTVDSTATSAVASAGLRSIVNVYGRCSCCGGGCGCGGLHLELLVKCNRLQRQHLEPTPSADAASAEAAVSQFGSRSCGQSGLEISSSSHPSSLRQRQSETTEAAAAGSGEVQIRQPGKRCANAFRSPTDGPVCSGVRQRALGETALLEADSSDRAGCQVTAHST